MPKNLKSISDQVVYAPILTNRIFPNFSTLWTLRQSCSICTYSHCSRPTKKKRKRSLHHLFSNFISVMSCVSVTLRIPLSLNNLWGACVFLQPETMISPLLPNATAHLSSCCLSFPPRLSPLLSAPLHHSQVVSGTSRNRGRLSWSFSLRPGSNGRSELLNISFRSNEMENIFTEKKFYQDSFIRVLQEKKCHPMKAFVFSKAAIFLNKWIKK